MEYKSGNMVQSTTENRWGDPLLENGSLVDPHKVWSDSFGLDSCEMANQLQFRL